MATTEKVQQIDEDRLSMISRMSVAVSQIPKRDFQEIKSFKSPPVMVKNVLEATLVLLGENKPTWMDVTKAMGSPTRPLAKRIQNLDPESVPADRRQKARKILGDSSVESMKKVSMAIAPIYEWCEAVAED